MAITRDTVIGILGAAAIVLATVGLFVVEDRSGPFTYEIAPGRMSVEAVGAYSESQGSGTVGPGGTCVPTPPATSCAPAVSSVTLELGGLPESPEGAHYVGFLETDDAASVWLGPLVLTGDAHTLAWEDETGGRTFVRLVVSMHTSATPAVPSTLVVYADTFGPVRATERVTFDDTYRAVLGAGAGTLVVDQIGAVEVSATAEAAVTGAEDHGAAWEHRAWFIDEDGKATFLGAFESSEGGSMTLDARVERVDLDDQVRFIVTVEPAASAAAGGPRGPVVHSVTL